jgi:hypothetical protein
MSHQTVPAPARIELHWAAQVLGAAADGWLEHRADDSHTAMTWASPILRGERASSGVSVGLDVATFALVAFDGDEQREVFPLVGRTLAESMQWVDRRFGAPRGIHARDYDMPESPIATGAAFTGGTAALVPWNDLGLAVLRAAITGDVRATAIRAWPHHFDLGAILYLDTESDAAQLSIGLSPGDRSYAEPYFYATPYPLADRPLPSLAGGGVWRREGWTGAVLTASALHEDRQAFEFMTSAIAGGKAMIAR